MKQKGDHEHEQDQDNDDDDQGIRAAGGCRGAPETMHRSEETATTRASNVRRHFYVDVQNSGVRQQANPDASTYHSIDRKPHSLFLGGVTSFMKLTAISTDSNCNKISAKERTKQLRLVNWGNRAA